ncbi:MAG: signal peptide peptidase SppA [Halioglobus sp.]
MKLWSFIRRFFSLCWRVLTSIRLALSNILFLLMIALVYFVYVGGGPEPLPERAALLLNPMGTIVDEKSFVEPLQILLGEPSPADHEVLLRDVIEAIDYAKNDPAINSLVMELDSLASVGISKTHEISRAIKDFKLSGKPVIARGDFYTQDQYLLASYADTVIVNPMGGVTLEGYSSYQNYFREALAKLSISMHVFKAGEHKSIAEPFLRDDMSPAEKEITTRWLGDLWGQYTATVEAERDLPSGKVNEYIDNYPALLEADGGDLALTSINAGLVDKIMSRGATNEFLSEIVGARNEEGLYQAVMFESYINRMRPTSLIPQEGARVAVITAQGSIQPGEQPAGTIGGDSLARLIRQTAKSEGVIAIVLRVNSGGGSVFASEVIRQELLKAKAQGMPIVISMGAVAASGGYYIAAEADQIWATPTTITGSIGVFAAFPTIENLMEKGGIYTDGVGTTELAGSLRIDRALNENVAASLTSSVEYTYQAFLKLVSEGRGMSIEAVDAVAQGRVWSAADALEHGLVDKLGNLEQAVAAAAELAGLIDYDVDYVGLPLSPRDLLLQQLGQGVGSLEIFSGSSLASLVGGLADSFAAALDELAALKDPAHLYVRCVACGIVK